MTSVLLFKAHVSSLRATWWRVGGGFSLPGSFLLVSPMQFEEESASNNVGYASENLRIQVFATRAWMSEFQGNSLRDYVRLAQDLHTMQLDRRTESG